MGLDVKCPKCGKIARHEESVDSFAYCDSCKKFVYVGNQIIISDSEGVHLKREKKV